MNVSIGWDAVQHVGESGAALVAFGLLWLIFRRVDRFLSVIPTVEKMASQFETNGGSTYRDKVNRIEAVQVEHTALLNQLKGAMNANPGPNERPTEGPTRSA